MPPQKKTNQEVIDEATKAAQTASNVSGVSAGGYKPITSASLTGSAPAGFGTYTPPAPPTLAAIDTQIKNADNLGANEQGAQDLVTQMLDLTNATAGKEAYRATQEDQAGVNALLKQQTDLTSQYNALVNEAQAIPLQLQEELSKRPGVSVRGATSVEEQSRQRQTAIKALTVNSLLQSTQGNIATARATADRAVNLRYADDEAKLATLAKNLDIIQKSPAYTAEQKKRATEQALLLEDRKNLIANKKEDEQSILAMASLALKNNPGDQGAQMAAEQAIASGDIKKAFSLLGQYQDDPMAIKDAILEQDYKRAQINALNTKSSGSGSGGGISAGEQLYSGLSSPTATAVRSKVSKFSTEPIVTNFSEIQKGYSFAQSLSDTTKNPSDDQALIYAFAKVMDPTSVVREGEYNTVQKYSQSWTDAYGKGVTQAIAGTGFLSETARKNIKKTLKSRYESAKNDYDSTVKNYTNSVNNLTGRKDGASFLTDYTNESVATETPAFDEKAWIKATPNYTEDLRMAKEAIAQGENPAIVKALMLKKYKTVEL